MLVQSKLERSESSQFSMLNVSLAAHRAKFVGQNILVRDRNKVYITHYFYLIIAVYLLIEHDHIHYCRILNKEKTIQEKYSSLQEDYSTLESKYSDASREITRLNTK